MRPLYVIFGILLLVASQFAAFNIDDYLYSTEDKSAVTQEELLTTGNHILYYVNGVPTVISSDDSVVDSLDVIKSILNEHYSNTVLPSQSELDDLRADILKFNDSRNYPLPRFGGGAEDLCLQETFLELYDCNSDTECMAATMKCYLWIQNGGGSCYTESLSPPFREYSLQVAIFNENIPSILDLLKNLNVDIVYSNLEAAKTKIELVEKAVTTIEASNLGGLDGPITTESLGLCSVGHLDKSALSSAKTKISNFQSSLGKLNELDTTPKIISENTATRAAYKKGSALLLVWKPKWDSFKQKNEGIHSKAIEFSAFVKDSEFSVAFKKFDTAWESMETRMTSLNFDGVESDMVSLQDNSKVLEDYMDSDEPQPYQLALDASNEATDSIIYAKYNVRTEDAVSVEAYNSLASRKNQIDSKFNPPMTSSQYEQIVGEYEALASDSKTFVQSQIHIEDSVSSAGGAFGQTSINAVFALTDALYAFPPSEKESVAPAIPPVVLFLIDLAAVSVLLVVFVGIAVKFKYLFKKRAVLGVWVALLLTFLFVLGAGSVMMFILIDQSAQSGTLQEFAGVLSNANSAYVIVNKDNAPAAGATAMLSCAQNISGQIKAEYNTAEVGVFELAGSSCKYNGQTLTAQECLDIAGSHPIMTLDYGTTPSAKFFVVYQKRADITGDSAYFQRCEIGDVLH